MLEFGATCNVELPCEGRHDAGASLADYMALPTDALSFVPLPAGASLRPLGPADTFELVVPELKLFTIWLRPVCEVTVEKDPTRPRLVLQSRGVEIRGSEVLDQFGINDRVDLDVRCELEWTAPAADGRPRLRCRSSMRMWLDTPPQFALMPRGALQGAGDSGLGASLRLLVQGFVQNMARDYGRWASDRQFRGLRGAEVDALAHQYRARRPSPTARTVDSQDWD